MTTGNVSSTIDAQDARAGLQDPIFGPDSATVHQALGWVSERNPAADGDCHGMLQGGAIARFLFELEELARWFAMDFAVAAAHASAATEAFTSPAWRESLNPLPGASGAVSSNGHQKSIRSRPRRW
jgi:hypothetical protein